MGRDDNVVVLGLGTCFTRWKANVQAALVKRKCLGHIFHDIKGIKPPNRPLAPGREPETSDEIYTLTLKNHESDLSEWIEGEMTAKDVLITRMSKGVLPQSMKNMTAKQLFDHVAKPREEAASIPYQMAIRNLLNAKFVATAEDYCDKFMQNYFSVKGSAESMIPHSPKIESPDPFVIPQGVASNLFIIGTESVEWLSTWRQTKVFYSSNYFVLPETMMSTLRQAAAGKGET